METRHAPEVACAPAASNPDDLPVASRLDSPALDAAGQLRRPAGFDAHASADAHDRALSAASGDTLSAAPARDLAPSRSTKTSADRVTTRIMSLLREQIGADRFAASFEHKSVLAITDGVLDVSAPNRVLAGLLERRFGDLLRTIAKQEAGIASVRFVVAPELFGPSAERLDDAGAASASSVSSSTPSANGAVGAHALNGSGLGASANAALSPTRRSSGRGLPLERYRLEGFVVGESNRLAYNAAVKMAEEGFDQRGGGLLFLHGPCGVGKTHLLHGLALRFKEQHPGASVRVTNGEAFMNDYVAAIRAGDVEKFRRAYRRLDLLCIDDVHFLSNKQSTQGELLHTFDEIQRCGARLALVSDEHPRQIKQFSAGLVSRFLAGMIAPITAPDRELRDRVVRLFARSRGINIDDAGVAAIVERTAAVPGQAPASVRDIEGMVIRVEALHRLVPGIGAETREAAGASGSAGVRSGSSASASGNSAPTCGALAVHQALGSVNAGSNGPHGAPRPVRIDAIIAQCCAALNVDHSELAGKTRHPRVVAARAVITHLARAMTTLSFPEIARAIGRPNHSTVITAYQRLQRQIADNQPVDAPGAPEARTLGMLVNQLTHALQAAPRR